MASRSIGPILATGAITVANRSVFNDKPFDWNVVVAALLAAGAFSLLERAVGNVAVYIAYMGLATVVITRVDPSVPSPAESALNWYNKR
jgi:hypothetical protein